jgi:hypothetical protein
MRLYKITAVIASVFSVLFSLSILIELQKFVDRYVFLMSGVFLVLFVIYNEISKVWELQKWFRKQKSSMTALITTIVISFGMSLIGILFWINSTYDNEIKLSNHVAEKITDIDKKYQVLIDSVSKITLPEYEQILLDLKFWKERRSDSKEQRDEILKNIRFLESKKIELSKSIDENRSLQKTVLISAKNNELSLLNTQEKNEGKKMNKNNLLSWIFFTMVLISEIIIVNIQKQIVNMFDDNQRAIINVLKDCELRNLESISINEFKFNRFNKYVKSYHDHSHNNDMWEETKKDYNILVEVGIIDNQGKVVKKNGSRMIESYFDKTNKF